MLRFLDDPGRHGGRRKVVRRALRPKLALALVLCAWSAVSGQQASESQVKAAYLYNFAKLAIWPDQSLPNAASPLIIGVLGGNDDFLDILNKTVGGRSAATHPVLVRRVTTDGELKLCHLVFIRSSAGRKRAQAAIASIRTASVLLVGEDDDFLHDGGMINLILIGGRVRFELDQVALDLAHMHLSPELAAASKTGAGTSTASAGESRRLKLGPPPEYPEIARKLNLRGAAQVELSVAPDGSVTDVRVIGGHPVLSDALVKAVKGWQYEPAGRESHVVVRFEFGK